MTALGEVTIEEGPGTGLIALSGGQTSLVIDTTTPSPTILHWGSSVGSNLAGLRAALEYPIPNGGLDVVAPISVTPEHGSGYLGRPGIEGHRPNGEGWAPRFVPGVSSAPASVAADFASTSSSLVAWIQFLPRLSQSVAVHRSWSCR